MLRLYIPIYTAYVKLQISYLNIDSYSYCFIAEKKEITIRIKEIITLSTHNYVHCYRGNKSKYGIKSENFIATLSYLRSKYFELNAKRHIVTHPLYKFTDVAHDQVTEVLSKLSCWTEF